MILLIKCHNDTRNKISLITIWEQKLGRKGLKSGSGCGPVGSLPTPDIRSSNPDNGKILPSNCTIYKTKMRKTGKELPILKKVYSHIMTA